MTDGLLIVFAHERGQRAQVFRQRRQDCQDFIDRCHALGGHIARLDAVDRDSNQAPPPKPGTEHTSFLDFEAGRRPVIEELVDRYGQRYANDRHKSRSRDAAARTRT